jgi:hypothetical protein
LQLFILILGKKILVVLENAKSNGDDNDKQKIKTLKAISQLTPIFLDEILSSYEKMLTEKKELDLVISKSGANMDYKEIVYQIEHTDEKIKRLEKDIRMKNALIEDLNIENRKETIEQEVSGLLKIKINIA